MSNFKEYVTSSAFNLSLSKNMIDFIIYIGMSEDDKIKAIKYLGNHFFAANSALERRGLICHVCTNKEKGWYSTKLTNEGQLVLELLKHAGFDNSKLHKVV